jgi:ATP-dependent RNA helicase DHX36
VHKEETVHGFERHEPIEGMTEQTDAADGPAQSSFGFRDSKSLDVSIDGQKLAEMIRIMRTARKLGLPDTTQSYQPEPPWAKDSESINVVSQDLSKESHKLSQAFNHKKKQPSFRSRISERLSLPMMAKDVYHKLFQSLDEADVLIVAGSTSCGKTTQVPQLILDHAIHRGNGASCSVVCTQPRRLSATSIAKRVAYERSEPVGRSVGYHVRFDRRPPSQRGSILYCTTGILLKLLQENPDYYMRNTTHLIIDEVHERSLATDHLLTLIRDLIYQRKANMLSSPKLILMSATIDSRALAEYFSHHPDSSDGAALSARLLEVPGRSFPVETRFLDDILPRLRALAAKDTVIANLLESSKSNPENDTKSYLKSESQFASWSPRSRIEIDNETCDEDNEAEDDLDPAESLTPVGLAAAAIAHVATTSASGDILAFLPGFAEIDKTSDYLTNLRPLGIDFENGSFKLFKLHSSMGEANDDVFHPVPEGCRRIVISTNIAESSITLPAVEHVIDMGKVRTVRHDHFSGDREYGATWISKSSSKQRLGRAGRVRPGNYYALFTRKRYDWLDEHGSPEMTRVDLTGTCLDVAAQPTTSDVPSFLARCPSPPSSKVVTAALQTLQQMGAITEHHELTSLGRALSLVPLEPAQAKTVLLGILFRCLEPMLIISCHVEDDTLVYSPTHRAGSGASKRAFARSTESDLVAVINAFKTYDEATAAGDNDELEMLINDHHIRPTVYLEVSRLAKQIYEQVAGAQLVPPPLKRKTTLFPGMQPSLNATASNIPLLKSLLMMTLTPNIAVAKKGKGREWFTNGNEKALLAPRTVNRVSNTNILKEIGRMRNAGDLLAYSLRRDMHEERYPWIQGGSMITPLMAALFGHSAELTDDGIRVNGMFNLRFEAPNNAIGLDESQVNMVILEFRKSIDRFLMMAFEDLRHAAFRNCRNGESETKTPKTFENTIMQNSMLRNAFVDGLAGLLQADNRALMERFRVQKEAALSAEKTMADARLQRDLRNTVSDGEGEIEGDDPIDTLNESLEQRRAELNGGQDKDTMDHSVSNDNTLEVDTQGIDQTVGHLIHIDETSAEEHIDGAASASG